MGDTTAACDFEYRAGIKSLDSRVSLALSIEVPIDILSRLGQLLKYLCSHDAAERWAWLE